MIRQRKPLPIGFARCPSTRTDPCIRAGECARGVEPHTKGREVYDFSAAGLRPCSFFIAVEYLDQAAPQPRTQMLRRGWLDRLPRPARPWPMVSAGAALGCAPPQ